MNIRTVQRSAVDEVRGYWQGPYSLNNPNTPLSAFFGDGVRTDAGVNISEETALRYSAVWSAVTQISQTVASLPLGAYYVIHAQKQVAARVVSKPGWQRSAKVVAMPLANRINTSKLPHDSN